MIHFWEIPKMGILSLGGMGAKWKVGDKATSLIVLSLNEEEEEAAKNVMLIYSTLGVYKGERLYRLARKGIVVERPARKIRIDVLKLIDNLEQDDDVQKVYHNLK